MKTFLLFYLVFFSFFGFSQVVDSIKIANEVDNLIQISKDFTKQRNFDKALEVNATAEKIAFDNFGRESEIYGKCCYYRGRVNLLRNDYMEAEKWNLEAKHILEKVLKKKHPTYANILNNLGVIYMEVGNYDDSESVLLEARSIQEEIVGKEHLNYSRSLFSLANLYWYVRNYEKSELLFLEAKGIEEKNLDKEHPSYSNTLNNLGLLYVDLGNYEKAEQLLLEAKAIKGKIFGKEHPSYSNTLNNLAILYEDIGNHEKAEKLYLEAKTIREKKLGKEHPDYADILNNLGLLYEDNRNYSKAEPLFLEAKSIFEKSLGHEHLACASVLNNLGILNAALRNYEKAERFYLEAKAIREKRLGRDNPDYVNSLNNLANLYAKMGNYKKAEPLHVEAKSILNKNLGEEHPDNVYSLKNLSNLYWAMSLFEKSKPLFDELMNLSQSLITKGVNHLSEWELSNYLNRLTEHQAQFFSFNYDSSNSIFHNYSLCYDNSLFYKGYLLNASNQIKRLALTDSVTIEKFNLLKSYGRRLASEYAKPVLKREGVEELEEKANEIEKELVRTVAGFGEALRQVSWKEVLKKLGPGEASVEFVHFQYRNPESTDSIMYAALLQRHGDAAPGFFPLFEEREITPLLTNASRANDTRINKLYASHQDDGGQKSLYDLIWKPMEDRLKGFKTIYCSPSGLLHRINLAATAAPPLGSNGKAPQIVVLGSTRRLVLPHAGRPNGKEAVLFGGVHYAADSNAIAKANKEIKAEDWHYPENNFLPQSNKEQFRGGNLDSLPESLTEVRFINDLLQNADWTVKLNTGYHATEEAFKNIGQRERSPRILHVASHGFFFPSPEDTTYRKNTFLDGGEPPPSNDNPMMRSGLFLAGADEAWTTGKAPKGREDGILTAYEIKNMDLSNTELVVLSACETGLGDIESEGVYGLQRAFKIAGAKYLIMSLWKVSDIKTREFMTEFYGQWLEKGLEIPEAFRRAQQTMKKNNADNPFFWAGFILVE